MKNKPKEVSMKIHSPKYKKVLFVPDIHAPFQDNKAINALIAFATWFKPDVVIYMGDLVDFYAVSHFVKSPIRRLQLQKEIDVATSVLKKINAAVNGSQKFFIRGNHEARLQKYLWTQASELSGLRDLQVEHLLKLDELGIKYLKDGRMKYRGMVIKHGDIVRKFAGYTAKGEFESTGVSGASGHTHRLGVYSQTNEAGDFMWMETGCLCKLNAEYMEGKKPNWQQGFGVGYYKEGSKRFDADTVRIVRGKAMYCGLEFFAKK